LEKNFLIGVVDRNSISRKGIRYILERRPFEVSQCWADVEAAGESIQAHSPLAAILINSGGQPLPDVASLTKLRAASPTTRLILIGETACPERINQAFEADFDGFILDSIDVEAFPKAIEMIILGERHFPGVAATVQQDEPARMQSAVNLLGKLSAAELRVAALLAQAHSNKVVARELGISESTVKVHVKSILRKTGARNRTDVALLSQSIAVKTARTNGLRGPISQLPRSSVSMIAVAGAKRAQGPSL